MIFVPLLFLLGGIVYTSQTIHEQGKTIVVCRHLDRPQSPLVNCGLPAHLVGQRVYYSKSTNTYLVPIGQTLRPLVVQETISKPALERF